MSTARTQRLASPSNHLLSNHVQHDEGILIQGEPGERVLNALRNLRQSKITLIVLLVLLVMSGVVLAMRSSITQHHNKLTSIEQNLA
jgi:hypothetical protein